MTDMTVCPLWRRQQGDREVLWTIWLQLLHVHVWAVSSVSLSFVTGHSTVAFEIRSYLCVVMYKWCSSLPDDSLTPHTLLPAMSSVRQFWRRDGDDDDDDEGLLQFLGVPWSVMDDIMASPSHSTEGDKRIAGLQYYIQTVPGAWWEEIAGVLWSMEEHTALEEVRQNLPSTCGEWLVIFLVWVCSNLFRIPHLRTCYSTDILTYKVRSRQYLEKPKTLCLHTYVHT